MMSVERRKKTGRQAADKRPRSLVVTLGPWHDKPWWWTHLDADKDLCALDYERLTYKGKHSQTISTLELPWVMLKVLWHLIGWRRRYEYVFTFECDLVGLSIAFWQSLTGMRRPKHVILQFIMREKQPTFRSRVKYSLMRLLLSSVERVIVSSRHEINYYSHVFGWSKDKLAYVPLHTSPVLLEKTVDQVEGYIIAAGRSFRDYYTLIKAVSGTEIRLVIVGGTGTADSLPRNDNVTVLENIPVNELELLILRARAVIVPLEHRSISTGQSVVLQAMALGKAVIATKTAGTVDYIDHMVDGLLVRHKDPQALKDMIRLLNADHDLYERLGTNARRRIANAHLPCHYTKMVREALRG
ncbi:Glycosyltransferase-like protein [Thioalkalivibrio sulfidiphilus HL-EbGr7]|uniref:Glycosyltransferase-like protein n=2 Tax=Thioalkalivibrio TaxID=106633 RepID=B8GV91_THISH|nr:Glycosyltransferase-like protein [Thioalkalivibrio sulfidiphilus HL-EbGr7]